MQKRKRMLRSQKKMTSHRKCKLSTYVLFFALLLDIGHCSDSADSGSDIGSTPGSPKSDDEEVAKNREAFMRKMQGGKKKPAAKYVLL